MTPAGRPEVDVGLPLWARVCIVVFTPLWLWIWFMSLRSGEAGFPAWFIGAGGLALVCRMWFIGAAGSADGRLTVRNQFSTRTFSREELADAVIDRANGARGLGWSVWLVLRDGSRHQVQLTQAPFRAGLFERALERDAAKLRAWIRSEPQPFVSG